MDILVMEIKLAINMWKQIPEIANQFEDLEYFVQQGGKKFYRHWCIPSLMVSWLQTSQPGLIPTRYGSLRLMGGSGHSVVSSFMQICSPYLQELIIVAPGLSKYVSTCQTGMICF